jgi:hypothetical protein
VTADFVATLLNIFWPARNRKHPEGSGCAGQCLAESETPKRHLISWLQRIPTHRVISMLRDGHAAVLPIGVIEDGLGKGKLEHDLALVIGHLKNGAHEVFHAFDP